MISGSSSSNDKINMKKNINNGAEIEKNPLKKKRKLPEAFANKRPKKSLNNDNINVNNNDSEMIINGILNDALKLQFTQSLITKDNDNNNPDIKLSLNKAKQITTNKRVNGSPLILVIANSAIRASTLVNTISKSCKVLVGKLFAKHFKVHDQVDALSTKYFPICVGTSARLSTLYEIGALKLNSMTLLIVDDVRDAKDFCCYKGPTQNTDDFFKFLNICLEENNNVKIQIGL